MKFRITNLLVLVLLVGGIIVLFNGIAMADHGTLTDQGNCPVEGKVEANGGNQDAINDLVLEAGTHVCIKAGNNDGILVTADGETTLQEYLFNAGIIDGSGEQGRDVSHYTIIQAVTTTTLPEEETTTTTEAEETTTTTEAEAPAPTPLVPSATPPAELPFTGVEDWLLPAGLLLLTTGGLIVRKANASLHS